MSVKRWLSLILATVMLVTLLAGCGSKAKEDPKDVVERRVRELVLLSRPQSAAPDEFESTRLLAEEMKKLGLQVKIEIMPWEQMADVVWYKRADWDMTGWQMVGRPERSDPDEFIYNLFHSSTAEKGYNFVGYNNPEYDKLAEAQRGETDPDKRKELVFKAQEILAEDVPYLFFVYPHSAYVYNNTVWDPKTVVEAKGIGIKNFWTFVGATPLGSQKDMVLNAHDNVQAINPLYISGGVDSWIYELIWDRLMRIDANGLPQPWAAEKVQWVDDTTVDVTLRQGMKWHDGKPVTVDDVVFSFQAPMGDEAPMYKPFVSKIAAIETPGGNVIRFKLKAPYAAFLTASLAKVNLIPKHIWEPILKDLAQKPENAESYQEKVPIGSGPFKFVHWKASEEVMLEANKSHFSPPKMNRWILRIIPNTEASLGMIQSGELNFLSDYGGDKELLAQKVKENPKLTMVASVDLGYRYVALNLRRPPFDDKAFRQALAMVTNRALIKKAVFKDFATVADSPISAALPFWHNPNLKQWEFSVDKARQLLKDSGYEWDSEGNLLYPKGKTETLSKK